jgi:hypothetical protein
MKHDEAAGPSHDGLRGFELKDSDGYVLLFSAVLTLTNRMAVFHKAMRTVE